MRLEPALQRLCGPSADGRPVTLVVAAHPDDETIGAGARIAKLAPLCTVAHVTDGAPGERRFYPAAAEKMSRPEYARARREEALAALHLAGVEASRVTSLGLRDQESLFDLARSRSTSTRASAR